MGLAFLKTAPFLAVVVISVVSGNIFDSLQHDFNKVENVVKSELGRKEITVKKWSRLLPASVRHMSINAPLSLISSGSNRKASTINVNSNSGFSWASCGPADQLVEIRNLTILPSPLYFPGTLSFGFDIFFHDSIKRDARVSADLLIEYRTRSGTWLKIPCIGQVGSCTYNDVCTLSQMIQCPDELKKRGIPCTCPINKGEYILPLFSIDIGASVFMAGDYRAKAAFTDSQLGPIACYNVTFTVG